MPGDVGDRIPSLMLQRMTPEGVRTISTDQFFAGRRVALFAVPGAFTPTCSDTHLPGFLARADELLAAGVDAIACTAVNDIFVLDAWSKATHSGEYITMLADGNGDLARALGLARDSSGFGMGWRSRRYAMVVNDGLIEYVGVESGREVGASSAEAMLAVLKEA